MMETNMPELINHTDLDTPILLTGHARDRFHERKPDGMQETAEEALAASNRISQKQACRMTLYDRNAVRRGDAYLKFKNLIFILSINKQKPLPGLPKKHYVALTCIRRVERFKGMM